MINDLYIYPLGMEHRNCIWRGRPISRILTKTCILDVHLLAWYEALFLTRERTQYADERLLTYIVWKGVKDFVVIKGKMIDINLSKNIYIYSFLECSRVLSVRWGRSIWMIIKINIDFSVNKNPHRKRKQIRQTDIAAVCYFIYHYNPENHLNV